MPKSIRTIRNILVIFIFVTLVVQFFPYISSGIADKIKVTDAQLSNFLTSLDITLSTLLVLYSLMEQKLAEKRCVYNFTVVENSLSLEKYRRYSTERKSTFAYVCERENDNIDRPYYGMEVELEEDALGSVGIPLCMKVSTKLNGKSIDFLDVRIYAVRQGKVETSERLGKGIKIEKPIEDGKEFLIRILLECNNQMQNILSESRIYLSFKLTLTDDREKNIISIFF